MMHITPGDRIGERPLCKTNRKLAVQKGDRFASVHSRGVLGITEGTTETIKGFCPTCFSLYCNIKGYPEDYR